MAMYRVITLSDRVKDRSDESRNERFVYNRPFSVMWMPVNLQSQCPLDGGERAFIMLRRDTVGYVERISNIGKLANRIVSGTKYPFVYIILDMNKVPYMHSYWLSLLVLVVEYWVLQSIQVINAITNY